MSEEFNSAQTNNGVEENTFDASEIAEPSENFKDEVEDVEVLGEEENIDELLPSKKVQDSKTNSEFARKRREQEQKEKFEKLERDTRVKTLIELNDGINPYTGEKMVDSIDVDKFLAMRKIERDGGDPIYDYHKVESEKQREEVELKRKQEEESLWYKNDRLEFERRYPELKSHLKELLNDEQFLSYGEGKFGVTPLADIYENYSKMLSIFEDKAKSMAEKMYANKKSSPGALNSTVSSKSHSWESMSDKEFEAEIEAAKRGKYKKN